MQGELKQRKRLTQNATAWIWMAFLTQPVILLGSRLLPSSWFGLTFMSQLIKDLGSNRVLLFDSTNRPKLHPTGLIAL